MRVLVISRNQLELERIPLSSASMTIGRSPTNDVVLRAPKVAPCHFLLEWVGTGTPDLNTSDWSVIDISKLSDEGSSGIMLSGGVANLDGFKFELRDDKMVASPDIGGRILEFSHEGFNTDKNTGDFAPKLLEVMMVGRDSGSVEEVRHFKPEDLAKGLAPLKRVPAMRFQMEQKQLRIILTQMPEVQVYNKGQKFSHSGSVVLAEGDLVQLVWGKFDIFLRFVTRQKVPLVPRAVILDPLLQKILAVAILLYFVFFGLIYLDIKSTPAPEILPPPRVATIEIIKAPDEPKVEPEPELPKTAALKPPLEQDPTPNSKKIVDQTRIGIPKMKANNKAGEAAAPKYVKDPNVKSAKIGLDSPAKVTNTNTVGILGAFGKMAKGKGVSSDKILNQGVVTQSISSNNDSSATVTVKNPPAGVLGTGNGGDPNAKGSGSDRLAQATTTFAGSDKYNPKAAGPIGREGATGQGWEAGTSLSKGGSGLSGGSVSGRGDVGSLDSGAFSVDGGLDRETVRRVINANKGLIRTCYDRALLSDSKVSGRLLYQWKISPSGPVLSSELKKTTMNNSTVENCVLGVIKQMQFPVAANGRSTTVIYPFEFRPKN